MTRLATALLVAALAWPLAVPAQDQPEAAPAQVYQAEPVGPEAGSYDVSVDLEGGSPVSLETFQAPLGGYGDWVAVGAYGTVWRPRVPAGWRPYYYGRWEWTTEGWLWVSDEPFGWATYHYGRWAYDRGFGWLWVPGYQWAPAWVSWRYSGDVVGWTPLAPGLSLYVTDFAFVDFWWTFMPTARFCGSPVYGAAYAPGYSRRWYDATRPAPPRPMPHSGVRPLPGRLSPPAWGGPAPRFVEERLGRPLRPARIVTEAAPGSARARPGEIGVYRPESRPRSTGGAIRPDGRRSTGWPPSGPAPTSAGSDRRPPASPAPEVLAPSHQVPAPRPTFQAPAMPGESNPFLPRKEPRQAPGAPAPTYQAPAPTYQAPTAAPSHPAPTYQAPAPSYQAPAPSYQAPAHQGPPPASAPRGHEGGRADRRS